MLRYNFKRIFKARGIEKPFTFLRKAGFSENFASRVKNNRVARLNLEYIEKLCILLNCTPNDLMEWTPDQSNNIDKNHPLYKIQKPTKIIDITKILNAVPIEKLDEIESIINDKLNQE